MLPVVYKYYVELIRKAGSITVMSLAYDPQDVIYTKAGGCPKGQWYQNTPVDEGSCTQGILM